MFAINGPSGPTTRCERRVATAAEKQQLEDMRKQLAKEKSESFFTVRAPSSTAQRTIAKRPVVSSKRSLAPAAVVSRAVGSSATAASHSARRDIQTSSDRDGGSTSDAASQIFKGCRIIFNGRTGNISSYYFAKLVQDHGGNVCSALTTSRVTHMVGANLSGAKADKVLKTLKKVKVVSPDWILQSIKLAKRQPEFDYLLYKDARQQRLC